MIRETGIVTGPAEEVPPAVLQPLPPHLAERTRALTPHPPGGGPVVVWLRTALRAHENPALDVAVRVSSQLRRPLLVVQALSERYRYASDRHHRFILEGARDLAAQLEARGIRYALHVERPGHRHRFWAAWTAELGLLVTDDLPIDPLRAWTGAVATAAPCAVWAVDCANVVPAGLVPGVHRRAFRFRAAIEPHLAERVDRPWPRGEPRGPSAASVALPFDPVDLSSVDLAQLVAACGIDHSVGPVADTPGGSTAGYARWREFVRDGLRAYARTRNDAARPGVSRMSAYLHYGMVAPTRIAREASRIGGRGAEKYLDELIVWRELANHWCRHHPGPPTLAALPGWAQDTLRAHASDERPALFDAETLARGRTGHELWDAAQRSLLRHGELHNNLRMTWGKAVVGWTADPRSALHALFDLNDRFALDGRDPSSVAGLLWCMGGMDRPFPTERPILGTVRPRPLAAHAERIDLPAYLAHVGRNRPALRVAVVGAGLAGAMCARTLVDHGVQVVAFDKGRGAGGRLSTRRTETTTFDHGAPCFTLRDRRVGRYARSWRARGLLARWAGGIGTLGPRGFEVDDTPRFAAVPTMNALVKHLLADVSVQFRTRVEAISRAGRRWQVTADHAPFDVVVVAVPAPQAGPLLAAVPALGAAMDQVEVAPCWAVLATLATEPEVPFAAARIEGAAVSFVARNHTKPGRPAAPAWVLHGSPAWSADHLEADPAWVAQALWKSLGERIDLPEPTHRSAHRWRYARVTRPVGQPCLWSGSDGIGACGDGLLGGRVESALLSGMAMAGRILMELPRAGTSDRSTQVGLPGIPS